MKLSGMMGAALAVMMLVSVPALAAGGKIMETFTTKYDFDTVKQNVQEALTGRGLVVNNVAHIGDMLERTGKDLGGARQVYVKAEAIEFCSASVSRKMMEADPHNIVFCPYIIVYFTLPQDPKTVYVGYRRPLPAGSEASRTSIREIENLLDGIVKEALNIK